jgi:DNA mismatch repair protein MutS
MTIPQAENLPAALSYKLFHGPDYSMVRYSVGHFADFIRGMNQLVMLLDVPDNPPMLGDLLERAKRLLDQDVLQSLAATSPGKSIESHPGHLLWALCPGQVQDGDAIA